MPREGDAKAHPVTTAWWALSQSKSRGYWIARFRACEEFALSAGRSLLLLPQSKSAVADFDQSL